MFYVVLAIVDDIAAIVTVVTVGTVIVVIVEAIAQLIRVAGALVTIPGTTPGTALGLAIVCTSVLGR